MPPGWQPTGHGDRVVAERPGSVPEMAPQAPSGVLAGRARELTAIATAMTAARRGTARAVHVLAADAAIRMPRLTQFMVPDRELELMLTGALAGLGDAAPALRARLLARHAVIAEDAGDRQARSDQAVRAARAAGDAGLLAEVLSARLYVQWAPETAAERLATSTEIIQLAVRTGDVRRELDGRMWRLIALLEFPAAQRLPRRAAASTTRSGWPARPTTWRSRPGCPMPSTCSAPSLAWSPRRAAETHRMRSPRFWRSRMCPW